LRKPFYRQNKPVLRKLKESICPLTREETEPVEWEKTKVAGLNEAQSVRKIELFVVKTADIGGRGIA